MAGGRVASPDAVGCDQREQPRGTLPLRDVSKRRGLAALQGHYAYYGITGNYAALRCFWQGVQESWKKWLSRRSQRAYLDWVRFRRLLEQHPLEPPVPMYIGTRSSVAWRNDDPSSRMR